MKTITSTLVLAFLFIFSSQTFAQKQIKLVHDGAYWARFIVTYHEYGQKKEYDSGTGMGKGWSYDLTVSNNVSNIVIKLEVNQGFWYGEACNKEVGSSGGTFTAGGLAWGSTTCEWKASDVGGSGVVKGSEDIDKILPGGNTNLHVAVKNKDRNQVNALIRAGTSHLETQNMRGYTPLHEAISIKSNEMVNLLIEKGANVHQNNEQGQSTLFMAINLGDQEIVQSLLSAGYQPNSDDKAIERAVLKRDQEMVSILMMNGVDGNIVLDKALKINNAELINLAILEGNAVPTIEVFKKTVDSRKFDLASEFLDNPASNIDPNEAMKYSISKNAKPLVQKALEVGGDPQAALEYGVKSRDDVLVSDAISKGGDGNKVLEKVIKTNQAQMFDVLMMNGVNASLALDYAVKDENLTFVKKAIESGATASSGHVRDISKSGKNDILQVLIQQAQGDPNDGLGPAMKAGKYKTAELLIQAGAQPVDVVKIAVEKKQKNLLITALDNDADPNPGLAPAVSNNLTDYAQLLFDRGATTNDVEVVNKAIGNNNTTILELMLGSGTSADIGLPYAITSNNTSMVNMLFENGATTNDGSLVAKVIDNKNTVMLDIMLQNGVDANLGISHAIQTNNTDITKMLIESGASASEDSYMALAAGAGNLEIVNLLLQSGASAQAGIAAAVKANSVNITSKLIQSGADGSSNELLKNSVSHNNVALTSLLVDAGADPNAGVELSVKSAPDVLAYFISVGVDVTDQQYLNSAVNANNVKSADLLVKNGANAQYTDVSGNCYLHTAASRSAIAMVSLMIGHGLDVNTKNNVGDTALHVAVKGGRTQSELVQTLINAGANVNAKNGSGETPLSLAKGSKVKRALKKAGASKS